MQHSQTEMALAEAAQAAASRDVRDARDARDARDGAAAAAAHWTQGLALAASNCWLDAARAFRLATRAAPGDALYWVNLANAQRRLGRLERAVATARVALKVDPLQPLALRILGDVLAQMHRYEEALEAFECLYASGVRETDALLQHGTMLQALRQHVRAIDIFMQAASIKPDLLQAHALMATSFRDMAMQIEAVECLKTVLALDPGNLHALSHLSYEKRHVCDWAGLDDETQTLRDMLTNAPEGLARVATVFGMLSLPIEPHLLLTAARGEALAAAVGVLPLPPVVPAERAVASGAGRMKIGMLSYDFYEHPVSQLLVEVLEKFDRTRFELVLYSTGPDDGSAMRQRMVAAPDHFVDLRGLDDARAADLIRAHGIDVLLDLQGHTRGHRQAILARRPAPVQAAFLGFPGTCGAHFIDYLIGDPAVTPIDLAHQYSEKLAQMPHCFQPNGRWRPLPQPRVPAGLPHPSRASRAQAGLPEDAFVMCAFNHTYKILPPAFDAWCAVMNDVPNAVLWLKETNAQLHVNVYREAAARGVAAGRIVFARAVPYADHFSRLALADVFVDTWPYNAHTTASDALWAGVPVVTLYGNAFASRVAASVLNAVGLPELAFQDVGDYRLAITALATDPHLLATYRQHLEHNRQSLPLFDSSAYVRDFQALLARMVTRWRAGLPCAHLLAEEFVQPVEQTKAKQ